jgi:hypothetical protein
MAYFAQHFWTAAVFYAWYAFLGVAFLRFLLPAEEKSLVYAALSPWAGMAFSGTLLSFLGILGIPIPVGMGLTLLSALLSGFYPSERPSVISRLRMSSKEYASCLGIVCIGVGLFSIPAVLNADRGIFVSIGNIDPWSYLVAAARFSTGDVRRYMEIYLNPGAPGWIHPFVPDENTLTQIGTNPRWLPLEILASLSKLSFQRMEAIYADLSFATLMLLPPLVYAFARKTLALNVWAAGLAALLCAVNCHIVYVAEQAFFPQLLSTGFFIGGCIVLPSVFEGGKADLRKAVLLGLLSAGLIMSYMELFPYFALMAACYGAFLLVSRPVSVGAVMKGFGVLAASALAFAPYQFFRVYSFLSMHAGTERSGWDMTHQYYLLPFQLGLHLSHPVFPEPSPGLEWVLGVPLLALAAEGFRRSSNKKLLAALLVPFCVVGLLSYFRNYNYAYYKNFTYGYFVIPTLVAAALAGLFAASKLRPVKIGLAAAALALAVVPAIKCGEIAVFAWRNAHYLSSDLVRLEALNRSPEIDDIFIESMSEWDALWIVYYLKDKQLGMPYGSGYIRNAKAEGDLQEDRYRYAIVPKSERLLGGFEERGAQAPVLDGGRYAVYPMNPVPAPQGPAVRLRQGFAEIEGDLREQWVWIGAADAFQLRAPSSRRCRILVDLYAPPGKPVEIILNGKTAGSLLFSGRETQTFDLTLPEGFSDLTLRTSPSQTVRDLRIFKLRAAWIP